MATPAEEMGLKVGDEVALFTSNDKYRFIQDDGTNSPIFLNIRTGEEVFISLSKIKFSNNVESPNHYQILPGVEVYHIREAILSKHPKLHPCVVDDWSRSWEYLTRMFGKNGLEDAKKARWYLGKLIERLEKDESL